MRYSRRRSTSRGGMRGASRMRQKSETIRMSRPALCPTCTPASADRFAALEPGPALRLEATRRFGSASSETAVWPPRSPWDFEYERRADSSTEVRFDRLGTGAHARPSFNAIRFQHTIHRAGGYDGAQFNSIDIDINDRHSDLFIYTTMEPRHGLGCLWTDAAPRANMGR
jgi:hypothetical protein